MKAQVNNDASGWNDLSNILWAESEPTDPNLIKGNYTHGELPAKLALQADGADLHGQRLQRLHRHATASTSAATTTARR